MDKMIENVLRIEAEALARFRKIGNADRVLRIMKRTAMDCRGERFHENRPGRDPLEHGLLHMPSLDEALQFLTPTQALDLFERVNLDEMIVKTTVVASWFYYETPFYSRHELAELIALFSEYLKKSQSRLLSTGYPSTTFERSYWLYRRLSRLYPIKIPGAVRGGLPISQAVTGPPERPRPDGEGNWMLELTWFKEGVVLMAPTENLTPCSYEEAPLIEALSDLHVRHIEEHRAKFLNLKLRILDIAHRYLSVKCNHSGFWDECMEVLAESFSAKDLALFEEIEEAYYDLFLAMGSSRDGYCWVAVNPITGTSKDLDAGGLKNLTQFIFLVEEELKIGKMHCSRTRFSDTVGEPEPVSYYQLANSLIVAEVDKIILDYLTSEQQEREFARQFNERMDRDFEDKLKVAVMVHPRRYDLVRSFAEFVEQNCKLGIDVVGKFVAPMLTGRVIRPISVPAGTTWEDIKITFLDGHNVRIKCRDLSLDADYKEMGFEDRRAHRPDVQWQLLERLAESGGTLDWSDSGAARRLKKTKQLLSQSLKAYFQINEDPFRPYKQEKAYRIRIRVATSY